MAGRFIAQLLVQGTTMFARAFVSAYQQALNSKYEFAVLRVNF
jgi:hypothetical protein